MGHPICHFEIPATDPEALVEFYRKVFGWNIHHVKVGEMDYWPVSTVATDPQGRPTEPGGINGGITKRHHPQQPLVNHVLVEDVLASGSAIEAAGGQIVLPRMPVPGVG